MKTVVVGGKSGRGQREFGEALNNGIHAQTQICGGAGTAARLSSSSFLPPPALARRRSSGCAAAVHCTQPPAMPPFDLRPRGMAGTHLEDDVTLCDRKMLGSFMEDCERP